jgi:hypothetical protein
MFILFFFLFIYFFIYLFYLFIFFFFFFAVPSPIFIQDLLRRNEEDYLFLTLAAEKLRKQDEAKFSDEDIIRIHVQHLFCGDNRELSKLPKPKS